MISAEQKQKALRLYRNKNLTIPEISNLTDISEPRLKVFFRQAFEMGILKPRKQETALKPRTPNGQGKKRYVPTGAKMGNPQFRPKYTEEQQNQIALDYYENGFTLSLLKEKWGIHPMQLQAIREKFANKYGTKTNPKIKKVLQFDKQGNFIAEFENGMQASKSTGIVYANINQCCHGRLLSAGGFVWKFKES